jgi:NADH-quinone oxidoreductase subunit F
MDRAMTAARARTGELLLAGGPVESLDAYMARGGGQGLRNGLAVGPAGIIAEVTRSCLRGRGGAGFSTGAKWASVARDPCPTKHVVCNGAEGEPGTFKDRYLLRKNPYQLLEGLAIAAHAIGARRAFVCLKKSFEREIAAVRLALAEMTAANCSGRLLSTWCWARRTTCSDHPNPTVVNNVETLSNVPHILRRGAEWFRSLGTSDTSGTMVFSISGDVEAPGVYELPMGTPLDQLVFEHGRPVEEPSAVASPLALRAEFSGVVAFALAGPATFWANAGPAQNSRPTTTLA